MSFKCNNCPDVERLREFYLCPKCGEADTCYEEVEVKKSNKSNKSSYSGSSDEKTEKLEDVKETDYKRIETGFKELDVVMGGDGFVSDSVSLIGGDPGIGKSTLVLQVAINVANSGKKVLYITGEESKSQVKSRGVRINPNIQNIYICASSDMEYNISEIENIKPSLVILDSIQTMIVPESTSSAGSTTQVKESAAALTRHCKRNNIAAFIIGHITKEGGIAGPKVLEHIVDAVYYFEGDENGEYRILRSTKNRFGRVNEMAVFEMKSNGLEEVSDPSSIFINEDIEDTTGSAVYLGKDGSRPIMMEVQSLVTSTQSDNARRLAIGLDRDRLNLILAIMQKNTRNRMYQFDVYSSIVGGLKIKETGYDVPLFAAIMSSMTDRKINKDIAFFGEIGLSSEIKSVQSADLRVSEAKKRGIKTIVLPSKNFASLDKELKAGINLIPVKNVRELTKAILELSTAVEQN